MQELDWQLLVNNFQAFFLILMRVGGIFFVTTPIYGNESIPTTLKAAVTFFIALVIFPQMSAEMSRRIPESSVAYGFLAVQEILIGISIGFMVFLVITAFGFAGQLFSWQMGLEMMQVLDPMSEEQADVLTQIVRLFGLLVFLSLQGHRVIIYSLYKSYTLIPVFTLATAKYLAKGLLEMSSSMFLTALLMAMPIMGTMFLTELSIGLMGRSAPQMNIMMLGWPIKILVGLATMIFFLPMLYEFSLNVFDEFFFKMEALLAAMGKG